MQSGLQRPTGSTSRPLAQELGHRQGLNARNPASPKASGASIAEP